MIKLLNGEFWLRDHAQESGYLQIHGHDESGYDNDWGTIKTKAQVDELIGILQNAREWLK